mmetsp:Transcript_9362/g.34696  ORF Transcript_9362/g.34696 Transcript_9362/m.34696 type:complete len:330 (-) Transcript_9362:21-1010(-)
MTCNLDKQKIESLSDDDFAKFSFDQLGEILSNDAYTIAIRTRLLWHLRATADTLHEDHQQMKKLTQTLGHGLQSESVLLQHEICYVMGQIGHNAALPTLYDALQNKSFDVMTRHEAGEAIGAIKNPQSLPILKQYLDDGEQVVRETCLLAIKNIEDREKENDDDDISHEINSTDPTPSFSKKKTTQQLANIFLDANEHLYKKYKAMFSLRNRAHRGDADALMVLCKGFKKDEGALFKHEIAFVLGQLQKKETADTLEAVLRDQTEHPMVRHEAAEALGSICDTHSLQVLDDFQNDDSLAVKHSCEVAIDMHKYWSQFAPTNEKDIQEEQ